MSNTVKFDGYAAHIFDSVTNELIKQWDFRVKNRMALPDDPFSPLAVCGRVLKELTRNEYCQFIDCKIQISVNAENQESEIYNIYRVMDELDAEYRAG